MFMELLYGRLVESGFALERQDLSFGSVILLTDDLQLNSVIGTGPAKL